MMNGLLKSPRVITRLLESGWYPSRLFDVSGWENHLQANGIDVFPLATQVMQSLGGIEIKGNTRGDVVGTVEVVAFGPVMCTAAALNKWSNKTNVRYCPIGVVDEVGDLLMDVSGKVYVAHSHLSLAGDDIDDALALMCFGRDASV